MTDLERIAAALERIAAVAEAWAHPSMVVTPFDPRLDPPEPDWRMPTEAPRKYVLSGDAVANTRPTPTPWPVR